MKWYMRRIDQGQTVETSYAYAHNGWAYMREHDRGDRTTNYWRGEIDWDREPECTHYDRAPCVHEWLPCDPPSEEES
jgi:hypothetical protein